MQKYHLHLIYNDHSLLDEEGQTFRDAAAARDEASLALMELWVQHGHDRSPLPDAIAVSDTERKCVTVIRIEALKTVFHL